MSLSLLCMAPVLSDSTRIERTIRWLFAGGWMVTVLVLAWILLQYGNDRGYLVEIAVISIDWLVLIVGAFMMAVVFRREMSGR